MSTNANVLLVVNPISGGIGKAEIIDFLKKKFAQKNQNLPTYYTAGKNDKVELQKFFKEIDPARVLVIGGDGTIKLIAEVLKDSMIPIGLFPAGSANGLAENLDLPEDLPGLTEVALGENFLELDCIRVNDQICLHISDVGLNAELIKNYEEGNIRGKLGYFLQSVPTLLKSDFPFEFTLNIEGKKLERKAFLVAIANARKYGTGATINPQGKFNDGQFEILVFKKFDLPQIIKTFQSDVRLSQDFVEIFSARRATITSSKPLPFQIDGEYFGLVNHVSAIISAMKVKMAVPLSLETP